MLYLLVPTGNVEWPDMRMFTSFSAVEQVVERQIKVRREQKLPEAWCSVIAYDGTDELTPVWGYYIMGGYLQRFAITQSL
jgi:hypothetical protein